MVGTGIGTGQEQEQEQTKVHDVSREDGD